MFSSPLTCGCCSLLPLCPALFKFPRQLLGRSRMRGRFAFIRVNSRLNRGVTKRAPICSASQGIQHVEPPENMKKTIAILALAVAGITTVHAGVHFGLSFGIPFPAPAPVVVAPAPVVVQPPMPAPVVEAVTACPTPGYIWVGGSWGWCNNHWAWTRGHWGPPAHWGYGYRGGYHGGYHGSYHGGHDGYHGGRGHR